MQLKLMYIVIPLSYVLKSSCIFLPSPTKSQWCSRPMQSTHSPHWSHTVTSTSPQDPILVITRMSTTNKVETKQLDQNMTQHSQPVQQLCGSKIAVIELCGQSNILFLYKFKIMAIFSKWTKTRLNSAMCKCRSDSRALFPNKSFAYLAAWKLLG